MTPGLEEKAIIQDSLMLKPEILLLDEPTSSLDQKSCLRIEELLQELRSSTTILMVTHYQDQIQRIADSSYELRSFQLHRSL